MRSDHNVSRDTGPGIAVVFVAVLMTGTSVNLDAQRGGTPGATAVSAAVPGVVAPPPTVLLPSDARLLPPAAFKRSDVQARRRIMRAWAHGSPDKAGPALLPLLEAGLQDADRDVRQYAVGVLQRVASEANRARATNEPVITDPGDSPSLYQTLLRQIDHPDPTFRAGVVGALTAFEAPPRDALEGVLLSRLATEVPYVRARIVTALAERATYGSTKARAAVLSTLDDPNLGVRVSAVKAMRSLRAPEALPVLLREMESARESEMRSAVARVLTAYGETAKPYAARIQAQLRRESDPALRSELERLVDRLERNAAASPR